jgi:SPP1 family phage portal protein
MSEVTLILKELRNGAQIDGDMISRLVKEHKPTRDHQVGLHERYKCSQDGVPIFSRTFEDKSKINNTLNNDFFSDIVDTKVGYFLGIPINYTYREPEKDPVTRQINDQEAQVKRLVDQKLSDFVRREQVPEVDAEAAKFSAICGMGARLCYIGTDGVEHIENVYPWECIFLVDDNDIQHPEYALRYWVEQDAENKEIYKAEFYDAFQVSYWMIEKGQADQIENAFMPDPSEPVNPRDHMFTECPLIGFPNNNELQGDCEKVLELIDGYDRVLSDMNSEIDQMRLAYMVVHGFNPDDDFLKKIQKTGVFGVDDETGGAEFIEKNLNDVAINNHLDRLRTDIYYFAGSPDFRDEAFAGNISGVALKFKLFKLESKCITAEREITSALQQMFKILGTKWQIEEVDFDPDMVEYQFKRNFPLNLLDDAQTQAAYKGLVSEKTRLSHCAIVKDAEQEIADMQADNEMQFNLDLVQTEETLKVENANAPEPDPVVVAEKGGVPNA